MGFSATGDSPDRGPMANDFEARFGYLQLFQPVERFWPFQWIETSLYVAVAVLLLALTVHRVRRRLA